MSRVFEAEELRLKRKVAVKVLSPELAQGLSVSRFEREIQTAAALQQANIVPVLSAGDTDGLPFYTMPFVDGESLRARLVRGPLSVTEVIGVLRDVSKALAYAHRQGVVHRDIKPDNVLLSEGTAVVTDFGIAKAISAARTSAPGATLTQIGTSIGTPAYMAPEQAAGDPDIDRRADIYSLGAMAYELLTGRPVFPDRTAQRMLAAHMSEAPRPVAELRPDTPTPLAELVMRCLAKEPSARPQNATDIVRVLENITSGGMQAMPGVLLGGPGMLRKALAIYAVAFFAVAILAKAAIVGIGLPDWVFPGSLVIMALGLPVILWTGYVQRVARKAVTATPTFTPGGTPSAVQGTMATIALRAAPHVSWYRTARGGVVALGVFVLSVAAFMGLRAMGVGPFGSLVASGKLKTKEPLLITDFRVTSADSSLGRVVSDAVRAGLSQSSVLSLLPTSAIGQALQRMEKPPLSKLDLALAKQVAERLGAKAIVDGDITGVGGGYIVVLRLVTADSGVELWSSRQTGDGPKGLIDATDRLARELRGKAGESLRAVQATAPLEEVTTTSLDALRKYSEGARYHDVLGDWPKAIAKFREAVAIDSNFAMAWRKLGAALGNQGRPVSEVNVALEQAHQHRDHLSPNERDYEEAFYYSQGPGRDRAKGVALYEGLVARGDPTAAVNLALAYLQRRDQVRAESTFASGARGNNSARALAMYEIAWPQANQGHWANAESSFALAQRTFPNNSTGPIVQAYLLYHAGAFDSLQRYLDTVRKSPRLDFRPMAAAEAGELALLQGRVKRAFALFAESNVAGAAIGNVDNVIADTASVLRFEVATFGEAPRGIERMDAVLAKSPLKGMALEDRPYFSVARTYARLGRPERARAVLTEYDRDVRDTSYKRAHQPALHEALGEIALADNKPADAVGEFRKADVLPDGPSNSCAVCLWVNLARSFDAAHQPDSAIAHYERYLSTPYAERLDAPLFSEFADPTDPVYLAGVRRRLGELYEAKGDTAKAATQYRAFVEQWKNADPELQPRVAEIKKRIEALTPVEKGKR